MYARQAGDYASTRHARGDPGLFSFLGGALKTVAGVAGSIIGGPIGMATQLVLGTHPQAPPNPNIMLQQPTTMPGAPFHALRPAAVRRGRTRYRKVRHRAVR